MPAHLASPSYGIDARFVEANVFDAREALGEASGAPVNYDAENAH